MTWRVAKSLDTLANEVNARWPGRSKVSDGTLGDQAHAARKSDHNPDGNGIVRARDVTEFDPDPNKAGDDVAWVVAETLRAGRDPRVKYVISRGRIYSGAAGPEPWVWRPYTGSNGHFHHCHVSVVADARADDTDPWGIYPADTEEGLTVADITDITKRLDAIQKDVDALTDYMKGKPDSKGKTRLERIGEDTNATRAAVGRLEKDGVKVKKT